MDKQFQTGKGHVESALDRTWLGDESLQAYVDDDSYGIEDFVNYPPDGVSHPLKSGCFNPELRFPFKNTAVNRTIGEGDENVSFWGPLELPSSIPSSLNPSLLSNSYDTRDLDTVELGVLGQPSFMMSDVKLPESCNFKCGDGIGFSTPKILPNLDNRSVAISTGQQTLATGYQQPTVTLKRKRVAERLMSHEVNHNLIDRESALQLCVKHIPDPTIGVVENVAKDFGFSFEFVMDLCCRYRKNRNSSSLGLNDCDRVQHFPPIYGESERFTISTKDDTRLGVRDEESSMTPTPTKRRKLDIQVRKEASKETQTKAHRCLYCDQTYSRHPDLMRHQKSHFPAQIHCPYPGCDKSFTRKDKLNDHWRRWHSSDMSQMDISQLGQDEPEKDPESGGSQGSNSSFGGGGNGQGGSSFQNAQGGANSSNQGWPSYRTSFGFESDPVEFYPARTYKLAMAEYLGNFANAKVVQKLGRGGFGSVYGISVKTGSHARHSEVFACKTISLPQHGRDEVIERARNEISILQLLDHPQIIKFAGAFILRDCIFINYQPLADSNLKVFLAQQSLPIPSLTKSHMWEGARGLASALVHLSCHGNGNGYHGDVKPENILVCSEAEQRPHFKFLLCDFGSAWILTTDSKVGPRNRAVTPKYCAPERFRDRSTIGSPVDVWSLGCVFAEIVTHLHDKTMGDFECFQPCNTELGKQWTYSERLPALNDWLRSLSLNWSQSAYSMIRIEDIDLIREMLLPDPCDRPSAAAVVKRLHAIDNMIVDKIDRQCSNPTARNSKTAFGMHLLPEYEKHGSDVCGGFHKIRHRRKRSPQKRVEIARTGKNGACMECRSRKVRVCKTLICLFNDIPFCKSQVLTSRRLV